MKPHYSMKELKKMYKIRPKQKNDKLDELMCKVIKAKWKEKSIKSKHEIPLKEELSKHFRLLTALNFREDEKFSGKP